MTIREIRAGDIEAVIQLFRKNYGDDYAILEFYDPQWVKRGIYIEFLQHVCSESRPGAGEALAADALHMVLGGKVLAGGPTRRSAPTGQTRDWAEGGIEDYPPLFPGMTPTLWRKTSSPPSQPVAVRIAATTCRRFLGQIGRSSVVVSCAQRKRTPGDPYVQIWF
jgi:hypothetical protein